MTWQFVNDEEQNKRYVDVLQVGYVGLRFAVCLMRRIPVIAMCRLDQGEQFVWVCGRGSVDPRMPRTYVMWDTVQIWGRIQTD